jgi:uncharacterized membrane protein YdfJ with MMPL/SSD domain
VLSLTVSLVAVFLPLLLMPGVTGRLFHEFAWVLAIAVAISMLVSLTLTPMMCAYLLKPDALPEGDDAHDAPGGRPQTLWSRTVAVRRTLDWCWRTSADAVVAIGAVVLTVVLYVRSQGPAARAGHRPDHRRRAGRPEHFLRQMQQRQSAWPTLRADPAWPACRRSSAPVR